MQFEVLLPFSKNVITVPSSEPNESGPYPSFYFNKSFEFTRNKNYSV